MQETRTFIVLGTFHEIQKKTFDPAYLSLLVDLIETYDVDFVAEETKSDALRSYAEVIAWYLTARWENVDLSKKERDRMKLKPTGRPAIPEEPELRDSIEHDLDTHELREWVWIIRATTRTAKACLLICGLAHTLSVAFKLASLGHNVVPISYQSRRHFSPAKLP